MAALVGNDRDQFHFQEHASPESNLDRCSRGRGVQIQVVRAHFPEFGQIVDVGQELRDLDNVCKCRAGQLQGILQVLERVVRLGGEVVRHVPVAVGSARS